MKKWIFLWINECDCHVWHRSTNWFSLFQAFGRWGRAENVGKRGKKREALVFPRSPTFLALPHLPRAWNRLKLVRLAASRPGLNWKSKTGLRGVCGSTLTGFELERCYLFPSGLFPALLIEKNYLQSLFQVLALLRANILIKDKVLTTDTWTHPKPPMMSIGLCSTSLELFRRKRPFQWYPRQSDLVNQARNTCRNS